MPTRTVIRTFTLSRKIVPCPKCHAPSKRHSEGKRTLREVGATAPTVIRVTYSKHYCPACRKHFSLPMDHLAPPGARFTHRARRIALAMVGPEGLTLERTALRMREKYHVFVPPTTLHDWVVAEAGQ